MTPRGQRCDRGPWPGLRRGLAREAPPSREPRAASPFPTRLPATSNLGSSAPCALTFAPMGARWRLIWVHSGPPAVSRMALEQHGTAQAPRPLPLDSQSEPPGRHI